MIRSHLRRENGFAITTLILIIGVASTVILGGQKVASSVVDNELTHEATGHMRDVARRLRDRVPEVGGTHGDQLRDHSNRMIAVANAMDDAAVGSVVFNIADVGVNLAMVPLQGGKLITTAGDILDVRSLQGLVTDTGVAAGAWDPALDPMIAELQGLDLDIDYSKPVERAIAEAKFIGARNALTSEETGLSPETVADYGLTDADFDALAADLVVELESDGQEPPAATDAFSSPFWSEVTGALGAPVNEPFVAGSEPTIPVIESSIPVSESSIPVEIPGGDPERGDPNAIAACLVSQGFTIVAGPVPHGDGPVPPGYPPAFYWEVSWQIIKPGSSDEVMTSYFNDCGRCTVWSWVEEESPYYYCY